MKVSRYILPTLKEDPSDAVVSSHRLMVRAGLIRKESAGMYVYLPLGLRVLRKVMDIVREEMDREGAMEFLMSVTTRKAVCFVVSDFLDDGYLQAMQSANRKHDVIACPTGGKDVAHQIINTGTTIVTSQ